MGIFKRGILRLKRRAGVTRCAVSQETLTNGLPEHPYVNHYDIYADTEETEFVNMQRGIRKTIVDDNENILNFPGISHPEIVMSMLNRGSAAPKIRYRSEFVYQPDGRHLMIWQIQPDGRYWGDKDGFGVENDDEIRLYTYLDENGEFTAPFKIYNIAGRNFFGTDWEEQMEKQRLERGSMPEDDVEQLRNTVESVLVSILGKLQSQMDGGTTMKSDVHSFEISGTQNYANLIVDSSVDGVNIIVQALRYGTDRAYNCYLKSGSAKEICDYLKSGTIIDEALSSVKSMSDRVDRYYSE